MLWLAFTLQRPNSCTASSSMLSCRATSPAVLRALPPPRRQLPCHWPAAWARPAVGRRSHPAAWAPGSSCCRTHHASGKAEAGLHGANSAPLPLLAVSP